MIRRATAAALAIVVALAYAQPAFAYLKLGFEVNGREVTLKWPSGSVRYFVTNRGVPGVSAADFQAAVARAFASWHAVPDAALTYDYGGLTTAQPLDDDGQNTLGFLSRPELERVLASTSFTIDDNTGALVESDIFFNSAFDWSVAPGGEAGKFDLESIALHEIGHFNGLGHSALGETELIATGGRRVIASEAVLFPIAFPPGNISDRVLRADDIAGVSDIYRGGNFASATGSISGSVTRGGAGVFGAHVAAFNLATGAIVANFTLNERGQFSIAGLSPGLYAVRAEPLDDADVDSFFEAGTNIDVNFKPAFADRIVVVPHGGDSGAVSVKVVAK